MAKLKTWSVGIKRKLDEHRSQIRKSDYKFFNVDRLERVAERLDEFSEECEVCKELKSDVEHLAEHLPDYLDGTLHKRREFEKRNDTPVMHLRKAHQLYPQNYFTSVYALAGLSAGLLAGGGISLLTAYVTAFHGLIFGFVLGLAVGYIAGISKDKKQKKLNLIL